MYHSVDYLLAPPLAPIVIKLHVKHTVRVSVEQNYGTYPRTIYCFNVHRLAARCLEGVAFAKHHSLVATAWNQ